MYCVFRSRKLQILFYGKIKLKKVFKCVSTVFGYFIKWIKLFKKVSKHNSFYSAFLWNLQIILPLKLFNNFSGIC